METLKAVKKTTKEDIFPVRNTSPAENLKNHVYKLSHVIGDRSVSRFDKLNDAAEYITKEFRAFGYEVTFQPYSTRGMVFKNIIVTKKGCKSPNEIVILGAHYDTCNNPGADDNASGVAGLLELARTFHGKKTERTLKFIAFVNEEPPFFKKNTMGSRVYTAAAKENGDNIKAALVLEMIGYYSNKPKSQHYPPGFSFFYPKKANFIGVAGNFNSSRLTKTVVSSFKKGTEFPIESIIAPSLLPGIDYSDNWSFWKEGYAAVMITDTAFYRNPHYHKASDTYETLDYESISEVVNGLSATLSDLAVSRKTTAIQALSK